MDNVSRGVATAKSATSLPKRWAPALSFTTQKNLELLFRDVCGSNSVGPVTVVCGAGVSMDGGLPSWDGLIRNLAADVRDPYREILLADPTEPMRKVEYALRLSAGTGSREETIRDALYRHHPDPRPGLIAAAIARVAQSSSRPLRILTTNYDDLLEQALHAYFLPENVEHYGIDDSELWLAFHSKTGDAKRVGVLHLHGLITPRSRELLQPIILTETDFRTHGTKVQDAVSQAIRDSTTLFVGVSLADPNLLGPLERVRTEKQTNRYILVVPEHVEGFTPAENFDFACQKTRFLADTYGVKPIFLKSYSQVSQLFYDLALAGTDYHSYSDSHEETSKRYGRRLQRKLKQVLSSVGCEPDRDQLEGTAARRFSDRLRSAMRRKDGPEYFLRSITNALFSEELDEYGVSRAFLDSEGFALFIWLRIRQVSRLAGETPPFGLELLGGSPFAHSEAWTAQQRLMIVPGSDQVQVQVAFDGNAKRSNLEDARRSPLWKSSTAIPLVVQQHGGRDVLNIGVACFQSNRTVFDPQFLRKARSEQQVDIEREYDPSVVSFLTDKQDQELQSRILKASLRALRC